MRKITAEVVKLHPSKGVKLCKIEKIAKEEQENTKM